MAFVLYNKTKIPPPSGLQNKGATCWLNSLLQMFMSFPALNVHMNELVHGSTRNEFLKLLNKLYNEPNKNDNLNKIYTYLVSHYGALSPTGLTSQECALEGFDHIIASFKNEVIERLFTTVYMYSFDCHRCGKELCANRDVSFRIPLDRPPQTQESFEEYVIHHLDKIDGEYTCEHCHHVMRDFMRIERLRRVNEILVFSLPKIEEKKDIWFPEAFSLPYGKNNATTGRLTYRLVAKIEHSGTSQGGHYYAHCLRRMPTTGDEQWVCLNDTSVSVGNSLPSANTFVIAYHMSALNQL